MVNGQHAEVALFLKYVCPSFIISQSFILPIWIFKFEYSPTLEAGYNELL